MPAQRPSAVRRTKSSRYGDQRGSSYSGDDANEGSGHESDYGGHGGVDDDDDDEDETSYKYQRGMVFSIVQKHFATVGLVWNQSSGDFVIGQLKSRGAWGETISSGTPTWFPPENDKSMGGWPVASKPKKIRELHSTGESAEAGGAAASGTAAAASAPGSAKKRQMGGQLSCFHSSNRETRIKCIALVCMI